MKIFNTKTFLLTLSLISFSFVLAFVGCDDGDITESEYQIQYLRKEQLTNVYTNEISPLTEAFVDENKIFLEDILTFKDDRSHENLLKVQASWFAMLKVWKRLELYDLGTVEDSYIYFEINRWPTNVENINAFIQGSEIINESFIASKGSSSKGISAVEYLLFFSNDNQEVLNTFSIDSNFQRRFEYLVALTNNLSTKANQLRNLWADNETEFIESLENGLSGSQSQLTNALITLIEEVVISKLGNPLGDKTGGAIAMEKLEAYRSGASLAIIKEHLTAVNRCYSGDFIEKSRKWGYENYLSTIGNETLDIKIHEAISLCQTRIDAVPGTLKDALITSPEIVSELQEAFNKLLVLIKVDLANALGTTVTINSNDGD